MPKIPQFSLSVHSFTPPTLPDRPADAPASAFRSPLIQSVAAATSPLSFTISLPSARDTDPLYPATHLQLSYNFEGTGEVFIPDVIKSQDVKVEASSEAESERLYVVRSPADQIPRAKVNEGATSAAEVRVYAWRGEKLLGKWSVGRIEGLGIEGLKSHPLAILRRDTWAAQRESR
ncbi:hypothetical protein N8I77_009581 [Diaporthe amygdali]|uniref:Uncharacterized protein n=1 Tax=Phomopsis amygdali TaxID=1214568 RepID=A0AAD9SA35_PHOAM|nr:hypothetical protein N8I77_009581 [Diaporthe amygdali]